MPSCLKFYGQTPISGSLNSVRRADGGLVGLEWSIECHMAGSFSSIQSILLAPGFQLEGNASAPHEQWGREF